MGKSYRFGVLEPAKYRRGQHRLRSKNENLSNYRPLFREGIVVHSFHSSSSGA
jgi:hypothetical protein